MAHERDGLDLAQIDSTSPPVLDAEAPFPRTLVLDDVGARSSG